MDRTPHYSFFPLHPYHLDKVMNFYFPQRQYKPVTKDIDLNRYSDTCKALGRLNATFPRVTMRDIERYCETAIDYLPEIAKCCRIDYKDSLQLTHCDLLEVLIYASIQEEYIEDWELRIQDKQLLKLAETLREAIEDSIGSDGWETNWSELGQSEMDDMNFTDPTWHIANDLE